MHAKEEGHIIQKLWDVTFVSRTETHWSLVRMQQSNSNTQLMTDKAGELSEVILY